MRTQQWLSLTSSSLQYPRLHQPSAYSVPVDDWYSHDRTYWGLDYPPLTAYHSLLLGTLARLSSISAPFVALRPESSSPVRQLVAWDTAMSGLERMGAMKSWMRASVVWGDLLVWVSAVVTFCRIRYHTGGKKSSQTFVSQFGSSRQNRKLTLIVVGRRGPEHPPATCAHPDRQRTFSVSSEPLFNPLGEPLPTELLPRYNSIMLGLTLWSVNLFHGGHDLLGAFAFVLSLGFKQMALYYSPAMCIALRSFANPSRI